MKWQISDGYVYFVLNKLKNKISVQDLVQSTKGEFNNKADGTLESLLNVLDSSLLLQKEYPRYDFFDSNYYERYERNFSFFDSFCKVGDNRYGIQKKLKESKVVLLGLGGLSSHLLYDLVSLGIDSITAVDFDTVELSNLNRQILYNEASIGMLKTEAAKNTIDKYRSDNKVAFIEKFLQSTEDIHNVIQGCDVVVGAVDRPHLVFSWINEACIKTRIPYIAGGIIVNKSHFFTVMPGETGCLKCWQNSVKISNAIDAVLLEKLEEDALLERTTMSAPVSLVATSAAFMLSELVKVITKISTPIALNKTLHIPFDTMMPVVFEEWEKDPQCAVCRNT